MKQTNTYIFVYASVMVIAVAAILSFAAMSLKPYQEKNREIEKKKYILQSVNLTKDLDKADNKDKFIENEYKKYITNSIVINSKGEKIEGVDAFSISMKVEMSKPSKERKLPIYICTLDDGSVKYIVSLRGKGLWGPIWGNLAFDNDFNTIYGVVFDHKAETPGLGAEITKAFFQKPFLGKTIFDESDNFTSIHVYKGGKGAAKAAGDLKHGVDAISGGTITSRGVESMLKTCLSDYKNYFKNQNLN